MINVDSTIQAPVYLTAREACALLDIKRETLYAYTSRGLVRSLEASGSTREKRYLLEDIRRLKTRRDARSGHGPVAAAALDWGEPVLDSRITCITPRGPRYRGYLATDLADAGHGFEAVAALLSTGALPAVGERTGTSPQERLFGRASPTTDRPPRTELRDGSTAPLARAIALTSALASRGAPALAGSPRDFIRAGRALAAMPAFLGPPHARRRAARGDEGGVGGRGRAIARAFGHSDEASARAVDAALILAADHELNVSAFTARVVASSGAELLLVLLAAMTSLAGPLHGNVAVRLASMLAEARAGGTRRLGRFVQGWLARGEPLPGFGHPLYPDDQAPFGDPRAAYLLARLTRPSTAGGAPFSLLSAGGSPARSSARPSARPPRDHPLATLLALIEAVQGESGQRPTLDVGLFAVALGLGSTTPAATAAGLFLVGRSAGWVAHAEEQRTTGSLLRPRARYVGEPAREVTAGGQVVKLTNQHRSAHPALAGPSVTRRNEPSRST